MELHDAINLINDESILQKSPAVWADLGCGEGLFSYALANILPGGSTIHAVDQNDTRLTSQLNPKNNEIRKIKLDFIRDQLGLENLDGILMANSLHFVDNKPVIIQKLGKHLKEDGVFIIVEYDTDIPNRWVPYPASFPTLKQFFEAADFSHVRKYHEISSVYNANPIYSAIISR